MSAGFKYLFSFVMPVYNVEAYLAETVESILAQSLDFEQNCEIIFVNDGSPDNSEEICLRYKEQFPGNVTYIRQDNAGPGAARNRGIELVRGKYISMVDSDDKISSDTLEEVYGFFEKHYDEIDVVAIKQIFFEARQGEHPLTYKFSSNKIIDLQKDYDLIQMSITSAFVKSEVLQKKHQFEESVGRYAEDSVLMGEVLLDKQKFGVVSKPIYFYRKRSDQASSLDTTTTDKFWYLETPKRAWYRLLDRARMRYGETPKFIQFMVMYDLQWRIKQTKQMALTETEVARYKKLIYGLLAYIDDDVIMAQRQINLLYKIYALSKKHGEDVLSHVEKRGHKYFYKETFVYDLQQDKPTVHLEMLERQAGTLTIEGFFDGFLFNDAKLVFFVGDEQYEVAPIVRPHKKASFLGDLVSDHNCFKITLPLKARTSIKAYIISREKIPVTLATHRFSRLSNLARMSYRQSGAFILTKTTNGITVKKYTKLDRTASELQYWAALIRRLKLGTTKERHAEWRRSHTRYPGGLPKKVYVKAAIQELRWMLIPIKSVVRNVYAIGLRILYFIVKPFYRRPIWIISDRFTTADDNGEVFFRYLSNRQDVKANVYFALSKKSSEYAGIKRYGKTVDYNGFYYKLLFILSDKVISSEAADYVINPFRGHIDDFVDLFNFDFVFLQHGIIKDDISGWLNRYDKNIKLFITSVKPEYESILEGDYGYDESVVKLTGLPRFDLLKSEPKRKLLLMPTWRDDLAGGIDPKDGRRLYNPNFKKSAYFAFYQNLIQDERIIETLRKHKFKGELYLHPSFQRQIKDFSDHEYFGIMQMPFDYPKAKREGNLLVTDYSSVAFDFAYLKKPIIYTHFDEDSFYKTHTSKEGYFSYEKDGFGPVVYNYNDTIKEIIKMIESGSDMTKEYQSRVEKFFFKFDQNSSKRVHEAILDLGRPQA